MEKDLRTLRKKEDNLMISGIAVLLFSVWDMVRFVMALIDIIISSITVKKLRKKYDIKDGEVV